jgi:hypothetical protein
MEPANKKQKTDGKAARAPPQATPEVIDILNEGPPGDFVIRVTLPTADKADDKKPALLRAHSLLLSIASPRLRQLIEAHRVTVGQGQPLSTVENPWILPNDLNGKAFLHWCILMHGRHDFVFGDMDFIKLEKDAKKPRPLEMLPPVIAVAKKLDCLERMKTLCAMPLWRFFGPRGEADENALTEKGLTVL